MCIICYLKRLHWPGATNFGNMPVDGSNVDQLHWKNWGAMSAVSLEGYHLSCRHVSSKGRRKSLVQTCHAHSGVSVSAAYRLHNIEVMFRKRLQTDVVGC